MIESSSLYPSGWDSDIFQDGSESISEIPSLFEIGDFPELGSDHLSACSNDNDFSSSSDDLILNELDLDIPEEFVSEIYEERNTGFSDLDWLSFKDSPKKPSPSSNLTTTSNTDASGLKNKKSAKCLQTSKSWSQMSDSEQLETLHALSEITFHMCIREQMEVIQIIDPTAVISPDDKEFALDSSYLDDKKLERIKDYFLSRQKLPLKRSSNSMNNFSSIVRSSKKETNSTKLLSRKSNKLPYSRTKQKNKKQNILSSTEDHQVKLERQTEKELKSGFFVNETKMKLTSPLEDDEDVNILE